MDKDVEGFKMLHLNYLYIYKPKLVRPKSMLCQCSRFVFEQTKLDMPRETDNDDTMSGSGSSSPLHVTRSPSPANNNHSSRKLGSGSTKMSPFSIASILASSSNHLVRHSTHGVKGATNGDDTEPLISQDASILAR